MTHLSGSAPAVGGSCGAHQFVAQLPEFGGQRALLDRGGNVLSRTAHLIDPVGELGASSAESTTAFSGRAVP